LPEVLQDITVKDGDTLWSVANFYLKDPRRWPEILKYNNLPNSDPNLILPGMRLKVPVLLIKEHLRAAHLTYVLKDVRYRRQKEAEWRSVQEKMELFNDDGLRTMQQSAAQVKFPSGEVLKLDENSLVILQPEKSREEVDLLSGGVRSSHTKILSSETVVDPRIEMRGPAPDFKTKVKEDRTTLVEVYDGMVDVTAQGRTVTVTKGFGTSVKFREPPALPQVLPPLPSLDFSELSEQKKDDKSVPTATSGSVELNMNIKKSNNKYSDITAATKNVSRYHLQVSTSSFFVNVLIDKAFPFQGRININFKELGLDDGLYFYRIAFVDDQGFEGQFTPALQLILDTTPPVLEVYPLKEQAKDDKFVHIEGMTEPDVVLKIEDKLIPVDETGKFITAVLPRKGENRFLLIATDPAGNKTEKEVVFDEHDLKQAGAVAHKNISKKKSSFAYFAVATLTTFVILGVTLLISR